jgi:hypothetical protein
MRVIVCVFVYGIFRVIINGAMDILFYILVFIRGWGIYCSNNTFIINKCIVLDDNLIF